MTSPVSGFAVLGEVRRSRYSEISDHSRTIWTLAKQPSPSSVLSPAMRAYPSEPLDDADLIETLRAAEQSPESIPPHSDSWDSVNVFDVRSTSKAEALNGEKYSDW